MIDDKTINLAWEALLESGTFDDRTQFIFYATLAGWELRPDDTWRIA